MPSKRQQIKNIIEQYKGVLEGLGIQVKRVVLYGSFAKGTARKDSDIDLVVVSDDFQALNLRERLEVLVVASARIKEPIEVRGYTSKEIKPVSPMNFLSQALKMGINF